VSVRAAVKAEGAVNFRAEAEDEGAAADADQAEEADNGLRQ
jgi:hypothetical protein